MGVRAHGPESGRADTPCLPMPSGVCSGGTAPTVRQSPRQSVGADPGALGIFIIPGEACPPCPWAYAGGLFNSRKERPDTLGNLDDRCIQGLGHVDRDRIVGKVRETLPAIPGRLADPNRLGAKRRPVHDPCVARLAVRQAEDADQRGTGGVRDPPPLNGGDGQTGRAVHKGDRQTK